MPEGRDCPRRGVLAKMMVDKVVYTKRQPNTRRGGATGHARIVFSCSNRTQFKPTSPHSSDVVGARRTGVGGHRFRRHPSCSQLKQDTPAGGGAAERWRPSLDVLSNLR